LILKDEKITITDAVSNAAVDGITGIALRGNATEFQAGTPVDTLGAGASISHDWTAGSEPAKGAILKIMLQDVPSGQVITQMQITVT